VNATRIASKADSYGALWFPMLRMSRATILYFLLFGIAVAQPPVRRALALVLSA
jgi:hypothetical protein